MKRLCLLLLLLCCSVVVEAQDTLHTLRAVRVKTAPKIDGLLDDEAWKDVPVATDFLQSDPDYKSPATQKTEVKVVYDDDAIYIGAYMYDTHPDSVLHELGNRDDGDLNSDYFVAGIDTYNKLIDAYYFGVSASGIQIDTRLLDPTFDAVWLSQVKLTEKGWCAEFRIPYSAIRFPGVAVPQWRIEFHRSERRRRELSRWPLIPKDDPKIVKYFGHLDGLANIKAPLRLSLIPYVSLYAEHSPDYNSNGGYTYSNSYSYGAGADLKYGLNERFTLDMTLLPDFSQVQSDNKIKNLSYREVNYKENRPFFKEGVELFTKNQLFYSRRIGRTPTEFTSIPLQLQAGETLESNPSQTRLLNSIKLSGRTNRGLGIGVFNAVTDNMYAVIRDSTGRKRSVLSEPFTNYNIFVLDQQLKHSSSIYLINTNVMRDKGWINANVTGAGLELLNPKNTIKLIAEGAFSQKFGNDTQGHLNDLTGFKYSGSLEKVGGNLTYGLRHSGLSTSYDQLDMGYYVTTNVRTTNPFITYDQYVANHFFRNSEIALSGTYQDNFQNAQRTQASLDMNAYCMLLNYLVFFAWGDVSPLHNYDYFEARVPGKVYRLRKTYFLGGGLSTDYRKRFAVDLKVNLAQYIQEGINGLYSGFDLGLRFRVNDKLALFYTGSFSNDMYNEGFVAFDSVNNPVFGGRHLQTYENRLVVKYKFNNIMSLSLTGRHYWNTGHYLNYYSLNSDGTLSPYPGYRTLNDFSYNTFNIDLVYTWIFTPGSSFSVIYKNAIEQNNITPIFPRFGDNFNNTLQYPQINSLSVKFLYYLDYQDVKRALRRHQ